MRANVVFLMVLGGLLALAGCADNGEQASKPVEQATPTQQPAPWAAQQPQDSVAVTVNGRPIMASQIENTFRAILAQQLQGKELPPDQMTMMRMQLQPTVVNSIVGLSLIEQAAEKENITVSNEEVAAEVERMVMMTLAGRRMTADQFDAMLKEQRGLSLNEWKERMKADPRVKSQVIPGKMLKLRYGDALLATEEEVVQFYDKNKSRYTHPDLVRASHILIRVEPGDTDEAKAAAKKQAEEILVLAKADGADFAALAREHSGCPSKDNGGDLKFIAETGPMVPEFSKASFALEVGEISEVIETQFGYHIITVTDKKEAGVTPLEETRQQIEAELTDQKRNRLFGEYVDELKKTATIVYAGQKKAAEFKLTSPAELAEDTSPAVKLTETPAPEPAPQAEEDTGADSEDAANTEPAASEDGE